MAEDIRNEPRPPEEAKPAEATAVPAALPEELEKRFTLNTEPRAYILPAPGGGVPEKTEG